MSNIEENKIKEAIEDINKAIIELGLDGEDIADAYHLKGMLKALLKQYKEAIEDFDKAIELSKDDTFIYNIRIEKIKYEELIVKSTYNKNMKDEAMKEEKKNINVFIKENIKSIGKDVYIAPDIPEKKFNNAIKAFKCEGFYESILAIQDGTLFGSAKEGFVFTGEKMIHHKHGEFIYSEIESVKYIEDIKIDNKGKEQKNEYVIVLKNNEKYKFEYLVGINKKKFANFLNKIITEFEDYEEENQLTPLAGMSEELKLAYLKIIINMTYLDDNDIDSKELSELFLLMTRIEIISDTRFKAREYIANIENNIKEESQLLLTIDKHCDATHLEAIRLSLVKDLFNIYMCTHKIENNTFKFIEDNKALFKVADSQIKEIYKAVEEEHKLLEGKIDDDTLNKHFKELGAKAMAAGVPLAAIYMSGSVIGMSAAGMTSGLATLGMGGILGLSSMATGIGAVAILGVVAYKGVNRLSGANELDKYSIQKMMLHKVIRQTQTTISLLIEDINLVIIKLNDTIIQHDGQSEKIVKLMKMMAQFQGALKSVNDKSNKYQNLSTQLECPSILDYERLQNILSEPTQKQLFESIVSNYKETYNDDKKQYILKENIDTETLDVLAIQFKDIKYFELGNIAKGKASEGLNKLKGVFG